MTDAAATLMTIYSLTGGDDRDQPEPVTDGTDYEAAERIFGRDMRLKSAPTDLHEWRPKPFGDYEWPSAADYTTGKQMPYTVSSAKTYFVNYLFAGDVLVLELRLHGSLNNYIDAQRDAFDRMVKKQLAWEKLLQAAASHVEGPERDRLSRLKFGQDKHQVIVLPRADAGLIFSALGDDRPPQEMSGGKATHGVEEPLDLDRLNLAALGKLMSKDVKISYRPVKMPISLPDVINGPELQMVAVGGSNTVVCGVDAYDNLGPDYGDLGARRIRELTLAAAQIVAAANRCREIRIATLSVLQQINLPASWDQDPERERVELLKYEHELHSLELDLAFGADVYRGPALVRGGLPLERYQEAVRAEGGFDASVELTHRMVGQLANTVTARRQIFEVTESIEVAHHQAEQLVALREVAQNQADQLEALNNVARNQANQLEALNNVARNEANQLEALNNVAQHQDDQLEALNKLLDRTEGVKTASAVVATIVVVVSCVGLFATLAVVPMSTSSLFLGPQFRSAAVAALSVIFAGLLGFVVYVVSKAHVSGTARIFIIIATVLFALLCPAGLVLAFILSSHRGTPVHVYALIGGMAAGFAAIILGAWLVDFGERRKRPAD
jgi:hypothetical protein